MFVQVAVERKSGNLQDVLSYLVPEQWQASIQLGSRVEVPFGRQQVQGYVVGFQPEEEISCKPVSRVIQEQSLLPGELVELALWVSQYYLCSCYYVLQYIMPKFARPKEEIFLHQRGEDSLTEAQTVFLSPLAQQVLQQVQVQDMAMSKLEKQYGSQLKEILQELEDNQLVERKIVLGQQGGSLEEYRYYSRVTTEAFRQEQVQGKLKQAKRQLELLRLLTYDGSQTGRQLRQYWKNYLPAFKELEKKQLAGREKMTIDRYQKEQGFFANATPLVLNRQQQQAQQRISAGLHSAQAETILLHGITGSGKTEIYLRALLENMQQGRGAIVLVPEISLTPQLIGRFKAFLAERVEVLHSSMSDGERYDVWQSLICGRVQVVVGVRSAVFAPVQNLGLIILDEEHETTFKQNEPDPRYHAREVALQRAAMNGSLVILGSATPSVSSYYHSQAGRYQLVELTERAQHQPMPQVEIVNMGREFQQGNHSIFSQVLVERIEESLKRQEQVILLMNRRGFASAIVCRECGYTLTCEKCSIALTYHKAKQIAKCHYCDYLVPAPTACPHCGSRFIRYMGSGTELVMEEIARRWPWVCTVRMDLDTTQQKDAHQRILEAFASGQAQIMVGTQMVAKGLDFPNVTTVGMLAADLTLNLPDYSAAERTFQLLTQVAGRAGRGDKIGRVVVQTYNPEHYSIAMGQQHNYQGFYQEEIRNRQLLDYPPFCAMIRILASDYSQEAPKQLLEELAAAIGEQYPQVVQLGPAEAPIAIVRKRYRYHLLLKHPSLDLLRETVNFGQNVVNLSRKSKTLRMLIDVEPQSVL